MTLQLLQICPHDLAPFDHVCRSVEQAGASLGFDVLTVFLGPAQGQPVAGARYLNLTNLGDLAALRASLAGLGDHDWGLIIAHRYRAYWGALRAGLPRSQLVAVAHEYGFFARRMRRINRMLRARGARFAGVSLPVAKELAAITGEQWVLPNVWDTNETFLSREAARTALGLDPTARLVGVVGRLHYKKRPGLALDAFVRLQQSHGAPLQLVFVGDGPQRAELQARAPEQVLFAGEVEAARRYFSAFDVLLHSGDQEAFGMVVLEAMAAGVPVVTGRGRGPEYILDMLGYYPQQDNADGFAAALRDALQADRTQWSAAAAQRIATHFSIAALARGIDELIDKAQQPRH